MSTGGEALAAAASRLSAAGEDIAGTARLDAELLLGFVLGVERTRLLAYPEAPLGSGQAERFATLVASREAGEPVAYLRGMQEFHGLALAVDERVLIPRPETELLVETALVEIRRRLAGEPRATGAPPLHVADVGTGSGAIAVALALALRRRGMAAEVEIIASDCSPDAAAVARENTVGHGAADRIGIAEADLLPAEGLPAGLLRVPADFDIICANLPYVPTGALAALPRPVGFEPVGALDGGPDGLDVIRQLLDLLPARTASGATAFLEIGADQAPAIGGAVAAALPGWSCEILPDLAGLPRLVVLRRPA